jgi:RHS repeat-associated protein
VSLWWVWSLWVVLGAGTAFAEPLCTDTWVGPASGSWGTASDWSAARVPTSTDVACVGAGKTVTISEAGQQAGAVEVEGSLDIAGGSLELASALEVSKAVSLGVTGGGTLAGIGTVDVTGALAWEEGTLSGSGQTVVEKGASASIATTGGASCERVELDERALVNDGTATLGSNHVKAAQLVMTEGARIENAGTFNDNSNGTPCSPSSSTIVQGAGKAPVIVNTGTFVESEGAGPSLTTTVDVPFENDGTFAGRAGGLGFASKVPVTLASGSILEGTVGISEASVTADSVIGAGASLTLNHSGVLSIGSGDTMSLGGLRFREATVRGAGTLNVDSSLAWEPEAVMAGSGKTVLEGGGSGELLKENGAYCIGAELRERTFVNDGTISSGIRIGSRIALSRHAQLDNNGVFKDESSGTQCEPPGYTFVDGPGGGLIVNTGAFEGREEALEEPFVPKVEPSWEDWGRTTGTLRFLHPVGDGSNTWGCSEEDPSFPKREVASEAGVCTASGDLSETQTDLSVGGRGVGLSLTRTYNSQAAEDGFKTAFGYGWTFPYSQHVAVERVEETAYEEGPAGEELEKVVVHHIVKLVEENGEVVEFTEGSGAGEWKAPAGSPDVLSGSEGSGFTLTLEDREVDRFSGTTGRLESITEREGNTTTMTYNGAGQLEKVTDPAGRSLKFSYNGEGLVKSASDPLEHTIEYGYKEGTLVSVSQPNEPTVARWKFAYEAPAHEGEHTAQLIEMVDGREGKTTWEYNTAHRVKLKTDPMGRKTAYEYGNTFTKITNEATKAVTDEELTSGGELVEAIHGAGTTNATTESFTYDTEGDQTSETNGDGATTHYEYDSSGNRILLEDPEGHKTKWAYNASHEVTSETLPDGRTTSYERESDGNPKEVKVSAPEATTEITGYKYTAHGETESMTNPLGHTWKYEYDAQGDRTAETDPEGDKRTWGYNADSLETTMVSPRGHVAGAKESLFTTTTERNARGLPVKIIAPLKHETLEEYDGDGNLVKKTDPEKNVTKYVYDADNELTETEEPNKTTTKTEYDGAGQPVKQTDGNGHATTYKRNVLEQVEEIIDPLGRKTHKEYDPAGNLKTLTDAKGRTTTYNYTPDDRLAEIIYSDGKTPTVKYEYNGDGLRTQMTDGTGTTTYKYDPLDRLVSTTDGHSDTVGYEYNAANEQTKITYPNGKAITREYDNAGRLKAVTDWQGNTTSFAYDADSDLTATIFPSATTDEDRYAYNEADSMSEVKMLKGTETLASLVYARNKDEGVTKATTVGLPGEAAPAFSYDENSRLTKGAGIAYKYDSANNPTTIASDTLSYDSADELEKQSTKSTTVATYSYNEVGERTKTTPTTGAATTYEYNQAGDLTAVSRPKEGTTPAIEDTYAYNGDGLRTARVASGTTTYTTWDLSESEPLIISDGSSYFVYGTEALAIEQLSPTGSIVYLHHDEQGSTRLITNSTGEVTGTATYGAYGNPIEAHGTTSPLAYDGQYTDVDTGLLYLRGRYYDPATAQFLTVDPAVEETGQVYVYALDNPVNVSDPTGLRPLGCYKLNSPCAEAERHRHRAERKQQEQEIAETAISVLQHFGAPTPAREVKFDIEFTENGKGFILREPGTAGPANTIRVMAPTEAYPEGYLVYYDEYGHPVNYKTGGVPSTRADYHVPFGYHGPLPGFPAWWTSG